MITKKISKKLLDVIGGIVAISIILWFFLFMGFAIWYVIFGESPGARMYLGLIAILMIAMVVMVFSRTINQTYMSLHPEHELPENPCHRCGWRKASKTMVNQDTGEEGGFCQDCYDKLCWDYVSYN